MRNLMSILACLLVLLFPVRAMSSDSVPPPSNDWSTLHKYVEGGEYTVIPWMVYYADYYGEFRYNFDWPETGSVFVGRPFYAVDGMLSVVPNIGVMFGDYQAVSPQLYLGWGDDSTPYKVFSLWQYASNLNDLPSFSYAWVEALHRLSPTLWAGLGTQLYDEEDLESSLDIGPAIKVKVGQYYLKPWVTWSPTDDGLVKSYLGVGAAF